MEPLSPELRRVREGQIRRWAFVHFSLCDDDIRACNARLTGGEKRYGENARFDPGFESIREDWEEIADAVNLTATAYANGDLPRDDALEMLGHLCAAMRILRRNSVAMEVSR